MFIYFKLCINVNYVLCSDLNVGQQIGYIVSFNMDVTYNFDEKFYLQLHSGFHVLSKISFRQNYKLRLY